MLFPPDFRYHGIDQFLRQRIKKAGYKLIGISGVRMFDRAKVKDVIDLTKRERWPYPIVMNMFIEAGVTGYEVNVARYEIVYGGEGGKLTVRGPKDFSVVPAANLNVDSLKRAIQRTQRGETNYPEFLREIAAAGVHVYGVNMDSRTVTYRGAQGEMHVETVPQP